MLRSEAFCKLCSYFFQDIGVDNPDQRKWIAFASQHLNGEEKQQVKDFIVELLNNSLTDRELQKVWFESSAEIYFPDPRDLRGFLGVIRAHID